MLYRRVLSILAVLVFLAMVPTTAQAALISHWKFDEGSGTTAFDSTGAFDGTLMGGASFAAGGVSGGAINITGSSQWVDMGTSFPGFTGSVDFSISAWVNSSSTGFGILAGKHQGGTVNGYFLAMGTSSGYGATGFAYFYDSALAGQEVISTTQVNVGGWHQIIGVYNAGAMKEIYVDGLPFENSNTSRTILSNSAPFFVSGPVSSLIDDVQVYSHALSSSEVQYLYDNPGQAIPEPATLLLLGSGLAGLGFVRRRKKV